MNRLERTFRKRFYAVIGCGTCGLAAFVWMFVERYLSIDGFMVALLLWWAAMFVAIFGLIRAHQRAQANFRKEEIARGVPVTELDRERCVKIIRSSRTLILAFSVFLVYGLFATQGDPLLPRMAGAGVDLLIISFCAVSWLRSRKTLRRIAAGDPGGSQ